MIKDETEADIAERRGKACSELEVKVNTHLQAKEDHEGDVHRLVAFSS